MCSLWMLFLLLWLKWNDLEIRTENLSSPIFLYGVINGCSLPKCFWQSKAKHYFGGGTKVFNSYLKVFNVGMEFLRQIKDSLTKNKSYAFGTNILSQSEFCSFSDWVLEIQTKFTHIIFIQDADSCIAVFFLDFTVSSLQKTSKKWH